jgi:hypothetical protein
MNRPAREVINERKIATANYSKSDMSTSIKWRVDCASCPLADFEQRGLCLSGFVQDQVFFESIRCNYLDGMSNGLFSKDNPRLIINCKGDNRKQRYARS